MTFYLKNGNTFSLTSEENIDIRKELPLGTYLVSYSMDRGYFLTMTDDLEVKGKVYGDLMPRADRIISTFRDRPRNTGVLLNGEKGSGKTLLSKKVSELCRKNEGVSTIIVNQGFSGDGFNTLMQAIEQPTVVVFDEFEKVYDAEGQEKILTLLDGVFPSKKLFILTVNDMTRVDKHMLNRPGRLFYSVKYEGLTREFILEYCADVLINKDHAIGVANVASLFKHFNFDMLQSMVEEMNRYTETPKEALEMLNVKPDAYNYEENYEVAANIPGWEGQFYVVGSGRGDVNKDNTISTYSPVARDVEIELWRTKELRDDWWKMENRIARQKAARDAGVAEATEEEQPGYRWLVLKNTDIKKMDGEGSFYYQLEDGTEILLKKKPMVAYDYRSIAC